MNVLNNIAVSYSNSIVTITANVSNVAWSSISRRASFGDVINPSFIRTLSFTDQGMIVSRGATAFGIPFGVPVQIATAVMNSLTWSPVVTVANVTASYGGGTTFTAVVNSELTITAYLWQVSADSGATWANAHGGTYSNDTTAVLTIGSVNGLNAYRYQCIVTNSNGSNPNTTAAILTVVPAISSQPSPATVTAPATANFTVTASGTATLTYQWQISTDLGTNWLNVATGTGGTTNSYTTAATTTADSGNKYRVVVTDGNGNSTTSDAVTLTVNP